jgi:hypothetical protein
MKLVLAIPSARLPRVPSFHITTEAPKVRIPFLSLLIEPRSLNKWLFIWLFCIYLVVCWACFFAFEQPRLDHQSYVRFGADSPTYWDAVAYRADHAETTGPLVGFGTNLFGPVALGTVLRTGIAVGIFNILLFFIAVEIACSIPGVNRYLLLFLLMICSETAPALVTLNKEILVLFSVLLMAKYVYSERRSGILLAAVLVASVLTRWEQVAIMLLFLFLRRKGSFFERHPRIAVAAVIAALTVIYSVIAMLPGSGIGGFTQYARGANTIAKLNTIQAHFGFPLVVVPKLIMDISGELIRPATYFAWFANNGFGDIHSWLIIPLFSIVLIVVLAICYFQGKLNPKRPVALLIIIYLLVVAVTPFVQPRYNYFVYVLLCLEIAKKEIPKGEEEQRLTPSAKNVPGIGDLNRNPEYSGF